MPFVNKRPLTLELIHEPDFLYMTIRIEPSDFGSRYAVDNPYFSHVHDVEIRYEPSRTDNRRYKGVYAAIDTSTLPTELRLVYIEMKKAQYDRGVFDMDSIKDAETKERVNALRGLVSVIYDQVPLLASGGRDLDNKFQPGCGLYFHLPAYDQFNPYKTIAAFAGRLVSWSAEPREIL